MERDDFLSGFARSVALPVLPFVCALIAVCVWFAWENPYNEWPNVASPEFELRVGEHGTWTPKWEWQRARYSFRVLLLQSSSAVPANTVARGIDVRVEPPDAVRCDRPAVDGWVPLLRSEFYGDSCAEVDVLRTRSIEYRVNTVPDSLVGRRANLIVIGRVDSDWDFATPAWFVAWMLTLFFVLPVGIWLVRRLRSHRAAARTASV